MKQLLKVYFSENLMQVKKMCQITIMSRKFEIPAQISKQYFANDIG
jgi:hypothetical protein